MSSYNTVFKVYKHGIMCHRSDRPMFIPSVKVRNSMLTPDEYNNLLTSISSSVRIRRFVNGKFVDKPANDLLVKIGVQNKMLESVKDSISLRKVKKEKVVDELPSADSCRKARRRLLDIIYMNDWNVFLTLTFDPARVDRYSPQVAIDCLYKFCHNYFRRQRGHYVFVPELHEDGAFHFHGFALLPYLTIDYGISQGISNTGKLLDYYTLNDWRFGNSKLEVFSDNELFSKIHYLTDYISTKNKKVLPRWYYSGGFLVRKPVICYANTDDLFLEDIVEQGAKHWKPELDDPSFDCNMVSFWYDDLSHYDEILAKSEIYYDPQYSPTEEDFVNADPLNSLE